MVTRRNYDRQRVEGAHSVLLELARILGRFGHHIVVVGGWVPELLIKDAPEPHVGSTDVDLALNHRLLTRPNYATIRKILEDHDYKRDEHNEFIYYRIVTVSGQPVRVKVDLLAGQYGGTGPEQNLQDVQDVKALKMKGYDFVFEHSVKLDEEGILPDGRETTVHVHAVDPVGFLVLKGLALTGRDKEKDPYDIYYMVANFPGGIDALAQKFRTDLRRRVVKEALREIDLMFKRPDYDGPKSIANFEEITYSEERERLQRDAYERVRALLEKLGIPAPAEGRP